MKTKITLTKKDCLVIFCCAVFLLMCMGAIGGGSREHARRVVCRTNLKGLGTAMILYANDFKNEYPVQGGGYVGPGDWKDRTTDWWDPYKDWADGGNISVGASLFLLVRGSYVSTKSFVCTSSDQKPYDGYIGPSDGVDIGQELVELWDFGHKANGHGPKNCVSYSYQLPYDMGAGRFFPADTQGPAGMALMADKNPWYDPKLNELSMPDPDTWKSVVTNISNDWDYTGINEWEILIGNAQPHNRDGQNVLFNDGHTEFTKRSDVGYQNDNIYTTWSVAVGDVPTEEEIRIGRGYSLIGTGGPKSDRDSWLVNDDQRDY
jgi:hypothetical protein